MSDIYVEVVFSFLNIPLTFMIYDVLQKIVKNFGVKLSTPFEEV